MDKEPKARYRRKSKNGVQFGNFIHDTGGMGRGNKESFSKNVLQVESYKLFTVLRKTTLFFNIIVFVFLVLLNEEELICPDSKIFPIDFLEIDFEQQILKLSGPSPQYSSNNLLNLTDFHYSINNNAICPPGKPNWNILLIIVHSATQNLVARNSIRKTWGSVHQYKTWNVRMIFLLGKGAKDYDFNLTVEHKKNGDIIQGNFVDSYRNMTYKHLMGYKWTTQFCPQADYIFKVDDDMFVDLFSTINIINEYKGIDIICPIVGKGRALRDKYSKWHVPKSEYPTYRYPPFCLGAGYIIAFEWLEKIYLASHKVKFFWIDDVFVTGILRQYAQFHWNRKLSLLYLKPSKYIKLDVDPYYITTNQIYFTYPNRTSYDFLSKMYLTLLRNDSFALAMENLWDDILRYKM